MANLKNLFEDTYMNTVPTYTFNFKNDGRNGLGSSTIQEVTDEFALLGNSVDVFKLDFKGCKLKNIELDDVAYTVVYNENYPDSRFIPIKEQKLFKGLIGLLLEEKANELKNLFE